MPIINKNRKILKNNNKDFGIIMQINVAKREPIVPGILLEINPAPKHVTIKRKSISLQLSVKTLIFNYH